MKLRFIPGENADATLIGLVQSAQSFVDGKASFLSDTGKARSIKSKEAIPLEDRKHETNEGTEIDVGPYDTNPIYGAKNLKKHETLSDTLINDNSTNKPLRIGNVRHPTNPANSAYQLGYRYKVGNDWATQDAILFDPPRRGFAAKNSRQVFETTALAIKGAQTGTYYGSVRWGWTTDSDGKLDKIPFKALKYLGTSRTFMRAAKLWNPSQSAAKIDVTDLPITKTMITAGLITVVPPFPQNYIQLGFDTRVQILAQPAEPRYSKRIKVLDGPYTGKHGQITKMGWSQLKNE